jgi:RNA polymerase sigma factor (TIGR02999 family)
VDRPTSLPTLIAAADAGDAAASQTLFADLYRELHRVAARQLHGGASNLTLGATTLLHECYLGMAGRRLEFPDSARFIAYAARAMRGLIVDYVRQKKAIKRGGGFHLTALDTDLADAVPEVDEMQHLHDALVLLQDTDAALAELVDLKFFCGFSTAEIAAMRQVSDRTVERDWQKVRLLLHEVLTTE